MNEARKKANIKWDKENMTSVTCKLRKEKATAFKEACVVLGLVPNQILMKAIEKTIADAESIKYNSI